MKDFLSERGFEVRVGSTYSRYFKVLSGVPQGTVLGPLLFLIFINDLPDGLKSFASLFADDLKFVTRTMNHNETQCDIEKLNQWQKQWLLKFNVDEGKCKVLHIGKNNPRLDYFMDGKLLPSVEFEKDLGLNITENLQWDIHI